MKTAILLCACLTAAILSGVSLLLYQNRYFNNTTQKSSVGIKIPDDLYSYQLNHAGIATISRPGPFRDQGKDLQVETSTKPVTEKQHQNTIAIEVRPTEKLLQPSIDRTGSVADKIKTIAVSNNLPASLVNTTLQNYQLAEEIPQPATTAGNSVPKDRITNDKPLTENVLENNATIVPAIDSAVLNTVQKPIASLAAYHSSNTTAAATVSNTSAVTGSKQSFVPSFAAVAQSEIGSDNYSYMTLFERAEQLKTYAEDHGYNDRYAFMVNMGMKSGKKRFFVVDLSTMVIVKSGIVAHGRGNTDFTAAKTYSNEPGSNNTALGMYKVGKYYKGNFGASYRLYGLEKSNDNAYKRAIVLHSMHCIPNDEIDRPIYQTEGCPALSPQFFNEISSIIDSNAKPLLLWIFDPSAENQHGNDIDHSITQISAAK